MKAKIVGFLFPLCCQWVGKELTIFTLSKTLTVLTENIYGSFCRTCRGFSVDSKLAGNVRDAQLPDSFRSRMYVVSWLPQIRLSCQLSWFYIWKFERSFPGGLGKFGTCMDGKRGEAKGKIKVNEEPLTSWRVVFTFLHSKNVKLHPDKIWRWRKLLFQLLPHHPLVWAGPGPTVLPRNWFGNFPRGQTFLSQSLLLSECGVYRRNGNCS